MNALLDRAPSRLFVRLAGLAAALCLCVVVFGGFVRLSHAGLSCPDWPTCYGKATWPVHGHEIDAANQAFPQREVEVSKAWREQFHRHLAAVLGLLVLGLALLACRGDRIRHWLIGSAVLMTAFAIPLYMRAEYLLAAVLACGAELLLLYAAFSAPAGSRVRIGVLTLALVIFQALLGMWTVTWNLKPIVVMGHLLGGMALFGLLCWQLQAARRDRAPAAVLPRLPQRAVLLVLLLLAAQIALGGWVSSNYAALACGDFPTCQGAWWPRMDFREGFVLWRGIGVDYEGGVLDGAARTAIHVAHRIGALLATLALLWLALKAWRDAALKTGAIALLVLLPLQLGLGIGNVLLDLPLAVAVAHNAGAALLVGTFAWLLSRYRPGGAPPLEGGTRP